jgi:hypothetical protein
MRAVALALALTTSACSFAFVRGKPPGPCTSTPVAPVIDTAFVVAAAVAAIVAQRKMSSYEPGEDINYDFLRFQRDWSIVGGAIIAGSAAYGWVRTTQCRRGA